VTVPEVIPFEVTEDLPSRGRLAVGASAGTGKTWTLAALATRYVAERGVPVGELLVVTFTRAAAGRAARAHPDPLRVDGPRPGGSRAGIGASRSPGRPPPRWNRR
jgi:hypothetical protein